jgi:hypothetical protein
MKNLPNYNSSANDIIRIYDQIFKIVPTREEAARNSALATQGALNSFTYVRGIMAVKSLNIFVLVFSRKFTKKRKFSQHFGEFSKKLINFTKLDFTLTFRSLEKEFFSFICFFILQFLFINLVRTAMDSQDRTVSLVFPRQDT